MAKPIRSRYGLTRCPRCRAHVQAGSRPSEIQCPFCAGEAVPPSPDARYGVGRAGLLAASLVAFSAAGCGGAAQGASDVDNNQNQADDGDGYAQDPADDPVVTAEYGVAPVDDQYEEDPAPDPAPVARYGLPPMGN